MKAVLHHRYGTPDVLQIGDLEKPTPGEKEILIKVHAATINRTDCAIVRASLWIMRLITGLSKPKRQVTGTDFAGMVVEVGNKVKLFKPGDRVWGFNDSGISSHAEYLVAPEKDHIILMPSNCSYGEAAASAECPHYALNFINKVKLHAGQNAVVIGATGAIGSSLLQMLKYHNVNVTAVCAGANADLVKSLGADKVIDFMKSDYSADDQRYDYVFDAIGKSTFNKAQAILKPDGIYISSELGPGNENPMLAITTSFRKGMKVKFPFPYDVKGSLSFTRKLIEEGAFRPVIDRRCRIEDAKEAFMYVASGQKIGNVILTIAPDS
jgi:NADPH:quinone reductase-like Zn-dependent oxidoreductase